MSISDVDCVDINFIDCEMDTEELLEEIQYLYNEPDIGLIAAFESLSEKTITLSPAPDQSLEKALAQLKRDATTLRNQLEIVRQENARAMSAKLSDDLTHWKNSIVLLFFGIVCVSWYANFANKACESEGSGWVFCKDMLNLEKIFCALLILTATFCSCYYLAASKLKPKTYLSGGELEVFMKRINFVNRAHEFLRTPQIANFPNSQVASNKLKFQEHAENEMTNT